MRKASSPSICKRILALLACTLAGGCFSLPPNVDQEPSLAYNDTDDTALGIALRENLKSNPGQSGFHLLGNGLDAFVARAQLAEKAERSIDAQYYLFHDDLVGRLFVSALLDAADRGVRVRLLLDDMALSDDKDLHVAALDTHKDIEVRIFNPFVRQKARWLQFLTRFDEATRRMHNKSFTVDNQLTVIGGRNIGNEYFDADPDLKFGDLDVLSVGPVVKAVSGSFDEYWNSPSSYPVATLLGEEASADALANLRRALAAFIESHQQSAYLEALRNANLVKKISAGQFAFEWGNAQVFYDDPAKITAARDRTDLQLVSQLKSLNSQINSELIVFSPYFVPRRQGVEAFRKLRKRGVRVRILTNSLASNDVSIVHSGYAKYRKALLRDGVELYEVDNVLTSAQRKEKRGLGGSSKASLHAKSFVIDGKAVFIGSMNFDPRSVVENTEIGVLFESANIAGQMSDWFEQNIDDTAFRLALETDQQGEETLVWYRKTDTGFERFTTEPNTGFWRRFTSDFLQILPIDFLL